MQSSLTVTLATVAVDTCGGVALGIEKVIQSVATFLGLHENQCQCFRTGCVEEIEKKRTLVTFFNPHHLLCDVLARGTNSTDGEKNVVMKEVTSKYLG